MQKRAVWLSSIIIIIFIAAASIIALRVKPKADEASSPIARESALVVFWGKLTNERQQPLGNIVVSLDGRGTLTNDQGEFALVVPSGEYPAPSFRHEQSGQLYEPVGSPLDSVVLRIGSDWHQDYQLRTIAAISTVTPIPSTPTPSPSPSATPTPKPTSTPGTKNYAAIGFLDGIQNVGITTGTLFGWTFDPDAPDRSISVEFYLDGGGGVGSYIGYATAQEASPDVNSAFNITGRHRYSFYVPDRALNGKPIRDGKPHTIYAHGIDTDGTGLHNSLLTKPIEVTLKPTNVFCSILEILPGCKPKPTPAPSIKPVVPTTIPTVKPSSSTTPRALSTSKTTPVPTPAPQRCIGFRYLFRTCR